MSDRTKETIADPVEPAELNAAWDKVMSSNQQGLRVTIDDVTAWTEWDGRKAESTRAELIREIIRLRAELAEVTRISHLYRNEAERLGSKLPSSAVETSPLPVPFGWARAVTSPGGPWGPPERDWEAYIGDDQPTPEAGWIPFYREAEVGKANAQEWHRLCEAIATILEVDSNADRDTMGQQIADAIQRLRNARSPEEPSADGLTKVRDRTANVALTCSGACRYSNGVLIADPACDTHGSAQKAEEPELCPRCQQSMPGGVALHTDHCPQVKATAPHVHVWEEDGLYEGAICKCGARADGWYCPDSPDHLCHYGKGNFDQCDHCGQPEERK